VIGPPLAQRVPLGLYAMFAEERSELSRGIEGLTEVVPEDAERLPKSPEVEYTSPNSMVFES
jgi:hypothetical protein